MSSNETAYTRERLFNTENVEKEIKNIPSSTRKRYSRKSVSPRVSTPISTCISQYRGFCPAVFFDKIRFQS